MASVCPEPNRRDVREGGVEVVDDAHRHLEAVELGGEVLVGGAVVGDPCGVGARAGGGVGVQDHALGRQGREGLGEEGVSDVAVDEEGLGGVADARAVGLGVDGDRQGPVEVGTGVDVDVAVADPGLDDGHGGAGDDGLDEVGATPRDEQVDEPAGGHQRPDDAVAALEQAHRVGGQPVGGERTAQHGDGGAVGLRRGAATPEDDGVAGLQAEPGSVDGDVGAGLVDHPDHPHRHPDLPDLEAVGQRRAPDHLADRVGQRGDVAERLGHGRDARRVEPEPVPEALGHPLLAASGEVERVGGDDLLGGGVEGVGEHVEGCVLLGAGEQGEATGGGTGGLGDDADLLDVGGLGPGGALGHAT